MPVSNVEYMWTYCCRAAYWVDDCHVRSRHCYVHVYSVHLWAITADKCIFCCWWIRFLNADTGILGITFFKPEQGRIIHCAGCNMGGGPRCFDVWTFSVGLNVTTTKKGQIFGKKSTLPEKKILATRTRKGPRLPALHWYGAPEWLIWP